MAANAKSERKEMAMTKMVRGLEVVARQGRRLVRSGYVRRWRLRERQLWSQNFTAIDRQDGEKVHKFWATEKRQRKVAVEMAEKAENGRH
jgi:hypothetical protein